MLSIYLSYAVSLVIPRVGEVARCGVLRKWDGTSFPKAIGTVVTERVVDTLIVAIITGLAFLMQLHVFGTFFSRTGTRIDDVLSSFSTMGSSRHGHLCRRHAGLRLLLPPHALHI